MLNDHLPEGANIAQLRNDNADATTGTALIAVGDKFESAMAAVMYHARGLVMATTPSVGQGVAGATAENDIKPQWYENWYDGLGYCECEAALS